MFVVGVAGVLGFGGRNGGERHAADRLDPEHPTVFFDEADHWRNGRSSAAGAKRAGAFVRISPPCRSSRVSRSSASIRAFPALLGKGSLADVPPGLTRPDAPAVGRAAELRRQRPQCRDFTGLFGAMQPYGAFTKLGRVRFPDDLLVRGRRPSESFALRQGRGGSVKS